MSCTCGTSSPGGDRPLSSAPSVTLMDTSTAQGELGWLLDPEDGVSVGGGVGGRGGRMAPRVAQG